MTLDLFATLIDSLFDDTDAFLFEVSNTDYVRNSMVLFTSQVQEMA